MLASESFQATAQALCQFFPGDKLMDFYQEICRDYDAYSFPPPLVIEEADETEDAGEEVDAGEKSYDQQLLMAWYEVATKSGNRSRSIAKLCFLAMFGLRQQFFFDRYEMSDLDTMPLEYFNEDMSELASQFYGGCKILRRPIEVFPSAASDAERLANMVAVLWEAVQQQLQRLCRQDQLIFFETRWAHLHRYGQIQGLSLEALTPEVIAGYMVQAIRALGTPIDRALPDNPWLSKPSVPVVVPPFEAEIQGSEVSSVSIVAGGEVGEVSSGSGEAEAKSSEALAEGEASAMHTIIFPCDPILAYLRMREAEIKKVMPTYTYDEAVANYLASKYGSYFKLVTQYLKTPIDNGALSMTVLQSLYRTRGRLVFGMEDLVKRIEAIQRASTETAYRTVSAASAPSGGGEGAETPAP